MVVSLRCVLYLSKPCQHFICKPATLCGHLVCQPQKSHTSKHRLQENIITMVQDDLANNFMNPHPGRLYNKPGGPNVYKDVKLVSKSALSAQC